MCHFTTKSIVSLVVLFVIGDVCPDSTDLEIKFLLSSLHEHDNTIVNILQNPKLNSSVTLTQTLDKFNEEFVQLVSAIKQPNSTFYNIKQLCNEGPKFLKLKLDNDHLRKAFNWSEDHLQEMYYSLGVSEVMWFELKQLDPKGEHFQIMDNMTKDELTMLQQMDSENRLNEFIQFTKLGDLQRTDVPPKKSLIDR